MTLTGQRLRRAGLLGSVFLLIWGAKLFTLARFGSDLPFWDQWAKEGELFYAPWFDRHEFWRNLLVPHNEHRIAPTLALNLGLLRASGDQWDARVQCVASAALHALLVAGLAWWAFRRIGLRWGLATAALAVAIAAPPIAWENILSGFQSQFYFLALFSLLALGGLLLHAAGTWRWFAGLGAAVLACVSMGSGMLVGFPVAVMAALRLAEPGPSRTERLRAAATLAVALLVGGIGWWLRPQAPWHAPFHAHSLLSGVRYALRCLSWPRYEWPWLAVVLWAPWARLGLQRLQRSLVGDGVVRAGSQDGDATDFILAGGLWVLVQIAAVTYSRAGASELPAPRYGDIAALGLVFSLLSFAQLGLRSRIRQAVLVAWAAALLVALPLATHASWTGPLAAKKADAVAYEHNVQAFVLTNDYAAFEQQKDALPFPSPEWLAKILRHPTLRRLLPESVREPIAVPGLAAAAQTPSATSVTGTPAAQLAATASLPPLLQRKVRVLTAPGKWTSAPIGPGRGYWKFETAGDVGQPGATLELVSAATHRVLASIAPSKPAGNAWRAAYVEAPAEPALIVADIAAPAHALGFSEPVEMSTLSFWTWRLTEHAGWLISIAALGVIGFAATLVRPIR